MPISSSTTSILSTMMGGLLPLLSAVLSIWIASWWNWSEKRGQLKVKDMFGNKGKQRPCQNFLCPLPPRPMNGVRRLLGAATGASPSSPDKDPPPVQTNFATTAPLSIKDNTQAPNWLPSSSILSPKQTSFGESIQSTAAFFLGKKDKGRQASAEEEKTIGSPYSAIRPLNGLNSHTKSSPHEQVPSPSHTPRNGSISDSPSPTLPSRVITRKSVNRSDAKRSSGFTNTRDELLFSLLASEAVVDSCSFTVLTSEEVEELKKVAKLTLRNNSSLIME